MELYQLEADGVEGWKQTVDCTGQVVQQGESCCYESTADDDGGQDCRNQLDQQPDDEDLDLMKKTILVKTKHL